MHSALYTFSVYSLGSQFVQKKDPSYKDVKENTAWTMDKFNDYVNTHVRPDSPDKVEEDWVYNTFTVSLIDFKLSFIRLGV